MALTLPANYENTTKLKNIQENWLFQLYYNDETNFKSLSFYDTTVDSVKYLGVVSNIPTIKNSIDVFKSRAKSGNINVNINNIDIKDGANTNKLSELLHSNSDTNYHYIGRRLKVYSQLNNSNTLSDCLLLFDGKIHAISHNDVSITLVGINENVYDNVELLNTNSETETVPLAFGQFRQGNAVNWEQSIYDPEICEIAPNSDFLPAYTKFITDDDEFTGRVAFRPAILTAKNFTSDEFDEVIDDNPNDDNSDNINVNKDRISYLVSDHQLDYSASANPQTGQSRSPTLFYYDNNYNRFLPLFTKFKLDTYPAYRHCETSFDTGDGNHALWTDAGIRRGFAVRPHTQETLGTNDGYSDYVLADQNFITINNINLDNIVDANLSNFGRLVFHVEQNQSNTDQVGYYKINLRSKEPQGMVSCVSDLGYQAQIVVVYEFTDVDNTKVTGGYNNGCRLFINGTFLAEHFFANDTNNQSVSKRYASINVDYGVKDIELELKIYSYDNFSINGELKIYDVYWMGEYSRDHRESTEGGDGRTYSGEIEPVLYTVADGVSKLNDLTIRHNQVSNILDAHRELLFRKTDLGSSPPENYIELLQHREYWFIRDSIHENTSLSQKLEQYQYEGGFIYTEENNNPKYIFIKNYYGDDDVVFYLSDNDYTNLDITMTDNVITKWVLERNKHPVKNNYAIKTEHNTSNRDTWGYGNVKENSLNVKLDALVPLPDWFDPANAEDNYIESFGDTMQLGIGLWNTSNNEISPQDQSNNNIGFLNYYSFLNYRPRLIVNLKLVNPIFYKLQCGDIVSFSTNNYTNMKGFKETLIDEVFMVTKITKKPNDLNVTLLELGS